MTSAGGGGRGGGLEQVVVVVVVIVVFLVDDNDNNDDDDASISRSLPKEGLLGKGDALGELRGEFLGEGELLSPTPPPPLTRGDMEDGAANRSVCRSRGTSGSGRFCGVEGSCGSGRLATASALAVAAAVAVAAPGLGLSGGLA